MIGLTRRRASPNARMIQKTACGDGMLIGTRSGELWRVIRPKWWQWRRWLEWRRASEIVFEVVDLDGQSLKIKRRVKRVRGAIPGIVEP